MAEAILDGYKSITATGEGEEFVSRPPSPFIHGYTKVKRWWNKSYHSVLYESCAVVELGDSVIVVAGQPGLRLKISLDKNELSFSTNYKHPGDGNVKRILVCPKEEINNPENFDDYYYDHSGKSIQRIKYKNGGYNPVTNGFVSTEIGAIVMTEPGGFILVEDGSAINLVADNLVLFVDAGRRSSFNTDDPTIWRDLSKPASTKVGKIVGTVNYKADKGGYLEFTGDNNFVEFPTNDDFHFGKDDFTVQIFARFDAEFTGTMVDFRPAVGAVLNGFTDFVSNNNGGVIGTWDNELGNYYNSNFRLEDDTWYSITYVRHAEKFSVYLNAVLDKTVNVKDFDSQGKVLRIGANYVGKGFKGDIATVLAYNGKALAEEEIKQNHDSFMARLLAT